MSFLLCFTGVIMQNTIVLLVNHIKIFLIFINFPTIRRVALTRHVYLTSVYLCTCVSKSTTTSKNLKLPTSKQTVRMKQISHWFVILLAASAV